MSRMTPLEPDEVECRRCGLIWTPEAASPSALDVIPTNDLVAELRRRNLRLSSADELLRGLSDGEVLDFVDAGAVTADQARDYMRRARLTAEQEDER